MYYPTVDGLPITSLNASQIPLMALLYTCSSTADMLLQPPHPHTPHTTGGEEATTYITQIPHTNTYVCQPEVKGSGSVWIHGRRHSQAEVLCFYGYGRFWDRRSRVCDSAVPGFDVENKMHETVVTLPLCGLAAGGCWMHCDGCAKRRIGLQKLQKR
jgi:hypothetical protein